MEAEVQGGATGPNRIFKCLLWISASLLICGSVYVLGIGPVLWTLHRGILKPASPFFPAAQAFYKPILSVAESSVPGGGALEGYFHLWGHTQTIAVDAKE